MIELSRLNGKTFVLNAELIRTIEATPDTVITLASGEKLMVREGVEEVVARATRYRKRLIQEPLEGLPVEAGASRAVEAGASRAEGD